ncbi:MAG: acyltransferase family protein, partial [Myxococcota bacterium]
MRAVAVLAVLFYHLDFALFEGGFIGVDVFFVISGFLITRIIKDEVERTGGFRFGGFYLRRIRRLIPALLCTVAASYLFGHLLFPPPMMHAFAESAVAAVLCVSNLLFYSQADYFDALAQTKPLLNTWTLGVEMQFYLVWPAVLLGLLALKRRWAPVAFVAGVIIGSTLLAAYWLSDEPSAAFYLLPARAGELAMGGL